MADRRKHLTRCLLAVACLLLALPGAACRAPASPPQTAASPTPAPPPLKAPREVPAPTPAAEKRIFSLPFSITPAYPDLTDRQMTDLKALFQRALREEERLSDRTPRMLQVIRHAELEPDDVVADIGCGTGFFEFAMLENQIPFAGLYAVDIDPDALEILRFVMEQAGWPGREKVTLIHSRTDDVLLPPESIDAAFLIDSPFYVMRGDPNEPGAKPPYAAPAAQPLALKHGVPEDRPADAFQGEPPGTQHPMACLRSLYQALRPGGRLHVYEGSKTFASSTDYQKSVMFLWAGFKRLEAADQHGEDFSHLVFIKE